MFDFLLDNSTIAMLLTTIATLLGVFGLWTKVAKVIRAIKEVMDVGTAIGNAGQILSDHQSRDQPVYLEQLPTPKPPLRA